MTTLLPVFIDQDATIYNDRRPVAPHEAVEAIVSHCTMMDDAGANIIRTAIRIFAAQALAYAQGRDDLMAGSPYYQKQTETERHARTYAGLMASLRSVAEPEAVQARADFEQSQRDAQDSRKEQHGDDAAAA